MSSLEWALIQYDCVENLKTEVGTQGEYLMNTKAETRAMHHKPRNVKDVQQPPEARGEARDRFLEPSQGAKAASTSIAEF